MRDGGELWGKGVRGEGMAEIVRIMVKPPAPLSQCRQLEAERCDSAGELNGVFMGRETEIYGGKTEDTVAASSDSGVQANMAKVKSY